MAAPISSIPNEAFEKQAAKHTQEEFGAGGASDRSSLDLSSVSKLLRILEELDKAGWLDVLEATLEQRNSLLDVVVDMANKPGSIQTVKSVVSLGEALTSLNPEAVSAISHGLASGVNNVESGDTVPVRGIWDVLKASRDPDISRAFSVVLTILKSVGEQLRPGNE